MKSVTTFMIACMEYSELRSRHFGCSTVGSHAALKRDQNDGLPLCLDCSVPDGSAANYCSKNSNNRDNDDHDANAPQDNMQPAIREYPV